MKGYSDTLKQSPWPLAIKLALTMVTLVIIAVVAVTLLSIHHEQQAFRAELRQQAELLLDTLEAAIVVPLSSPDTDVLPDIIPDIIEVLGKNRKILVSIRIYDDEGNIIADAYDKDPTSSVEHDPFEQQLVETNTTVFEWRPDQLIAGRRVIVKRQLVGVLIVDLPTASLQDKIAAARKRGIGTVLTASFISILLTLLISYSIIKPLQKTEEHNLLHTLINNLPDLIYVKDANSRYLLVNDAIVRSMALSAQDELVGKTDFDFHSLEMAEQYYSDEQAILDSGQAFINREEPVIDPQTETIRWLLSTKVPFRDSKGNIVGLVGINRDITERKRMEAQLLTAHAELKEKNDQLAKLNTSKDKFFSIISHDLRSPLNVVLGYSQLIDEDFETYSRDEIKTYIRDLRESAEKLYTLLENLLTWSRIQQGAMECFFEDLNLSRLTAQTIELSLLQAEQKQITLQSSVGSEMSVYADHYMVSTILRNLLSNALKFTSSGGLIEISARRNETGVEVAVSDTGVGIKKEDIPKLFRIDVRHTLVGTAGEEGTGLGLSLCKELVEKNGGTIWVESEVGKGTTFRFILPQKSGSENL